MADNNTARVDLGMPSTWWDLIERRAALSPDEVMLFDEAGRSLTFGKFRVVAERVAAGLMGRGIAPGAVVSWQLPTVLESAVLMAALSRIGAVQNPIIPILRHAEVGHIVGQVKASVLITPPVWRGFDYAAMATEIAASTGCTTMVVDHTQPGPDGLALPMGDPATLPPPPPGEAATATRWILYSSGTTAAPKGAKHCDRSIMAGSNGTVDQVAMGPDDVLPIAFPITHIGGHCMITTQLRVGSRLLLIEAFDAAKSPLVMAEHGATLLGSALPFFLAYLAAQAAHGPEKLFPKLRLCVAGGAPTPPELLPQIKRELGGGGLVSGWGLTEFPVATFASHDDPEEVMMHTVGRATRDVKIRVVSTDGREQPPGEEGELRVHGPQMLSGYVDAALDADAFDEQGYFRTGDLGTIDSDGVVRITGRLKDIIIRNAENISATEVENVLFTHPDIADVAVVGIPDPRTGERCCAVVVLREGVGGLTLASIAEHCRAQGLATLKIPERIEVVSALPRNAMGKLLKQQIRAAVLG